MGVAVQILKTKKIQIIGFGFFSHGLFTTETMGEMPNGCYVKHSWQQVSVLLMSDLAERLHILVSPSVVSEWFPKRVGKRGCPCIRILSSCLCRPVEQPGWP